MRPPTRPSRVRTLPVPRLCAPKANALVARPRSRQPWPGDGRELLQVTQGGLELSLPEPEEAVLVRPDLVEVEVVVAGREVLADRLEDRLDVGPAGHGLRRLLLADHGGRLLEVRPRREVLGELALDAAVGPALVDGLAGAPGVLRPAHVDLGVAGPV